LPAKNPRIRLLAPLLALTAGVPGARAQLGPLPGLSTALIGQANGVAPLDANARASGLAVLPTGGSIPRSLAARLGDVLSPLDIGASCNGVADDSATLAAAIAAHQQLRLPPALTCNAPSLSAAVLAGSGLYGGGVVKGVGGASYTTPSLATVAQVAGAAIPAAMLGQPGGPLQLTSSATIRLNLAAGAATPASDLLHGGASGTVTAATYDAQHYPHGFAFQHLWVGGDNLTFDSSMVGRNGAAGQEVDYNFGGPQATGPRAAQILYANMAQPMKPGENAFYGAQWAFAISGQPMGGTASNPLGNLYAVNPQCQLYTGATFYGTLQCVETDIELDAGASAVYKWGNNVTTIGNDAVHGTLGEAAYHVGAVPSTGGWNYGLLFSTYSGGTPISPTGTVLGFMTTPGGTLGPVGNGIDLRNLTINGYAFASPGYQVNGAGGVYASSVVSPTLTAAGTVAAPGFSAGNDAVNGQVNVGLGAGTGTPYIDYFGVSGMRMIGDAAGKLSINSRSLGLAVASFQASASGNSFVVNGAGNFVGALAAASMTVSADPALPLGVATKQYVDAHGSTLALGTTTGTAFDGGSGATLATQVATKAPLNIPVTTVYTATGAIAPTDRLALINAPSGTQAVMTLANGTTDGAQIIVKRYGPGTVTLAATVDGVAQTITMNTVGTVRESARLRWSAAVSSYLSEN
jgi:hypothetical protein